MPSWVPAPDAIAAELLEEEFGIAVEGVEFLERESTNDIFRVSSGRGRLIVKRLGRPGSPVWHDFQAEVLDRLAAQGYPAPGLLSTPDGRKTVSWAGSVWHVSPWVNGREFAAGNAADVVAAAVCLDRLHALAAGLPSTSPAAPVAEVTPWLAGDEGDLASMLALVAELRPGAPEREVYRRAWQRARPALSGWDGLPRTVTHGEFIGSNVLYDRRGSVACVLDWDAVECGPRVRDLARGCLFFARRARGGIDVFSELVWVFLREATRTVALTEAERVAIVPFLELFFVPTKGYLTVMAQERPDMIDWYLGWSAHGAGRVRDILGPILAEV
jgi:Ser/Thr protein kinase RdoA (MazF antagonist)